MKGYENSGRGIPIESNKASISMRNSDESTQNPAGKNLGQMVRIAT